MIDWKCFGCMCVVVVVLAAADVAGVATHNVAVGVADSGDTDHDIAVVGGRINIAAVVVVHMIWKLPMEGMIRWHLFSRFLPNKF